MIQLSVTSPSHNSSLAVGARVPLGTSGIVTVRGRNDVPTDQKLGIAWTIADPDGIIAESYSHWETWATAPGDTQDFTGGRFDINKPGTWRIRIELVMNLDSPVVVDSYEGDLCTVTTELPPEYELIQHTVYPFAYIYDGGVEVTTATFKTDPFTPSAWMGDVFATRLEEEIRAKGSRPIEVKVYVDTSPLLWTNFRIEVTGTPLAQGTEAGVSVGIPIWAAILIAALAIIAVIVVATLAAKTISQLFRHQVGLKDVKPGWSKDTLIQTIHDSEEHWDRPLTPTETLEGMSKPELRDHLDQIAEEEVPAEISWWPIAVIGGVVVLGIGVAVATRK